MDKSDYSLSVSFDGYTFSPGTVSDIKRKENGADASGNITVTRSFAGVFQGQALAVIERRGTTGW